MPKILALTLALVAGLATPTLAQTGADARVTPPAAPGQELGQPQLQQAERRLRQAADRLQEAARSGDGRLAEQARRETLQALDQVRQALDRAEDPLHALRGEQIVGQPIHGANGEEIGTVVEVVVRRDGGGRAAVVGVGGFLGIGEHDVAIPLDRLERGQGDRLTTDMTREQIASMKSYDASAYEAVGSGAAFGEAESG